MILSTLMQASDQFHITGISSSDFVHIKYGVWLSHLYSHTNRYIIPHHTTSSPSLPLLPTPPSHPHQNPSLPPSPIPLPPTLTNTPSLPPSPIPLPSHPHQYPSLPPSPIPLPPTLTNTPPSHPHQYPSLPPSPIPLPPTLTNTPPSHPHQYPSLPTPTLPTTPIPGIGGILRSLYTNSSSLSGLSMSTEYLFVFLKKR